MKILIADDDTQLIRALAITLKAHGYDVLAAKDGIEAVTLASAEHPDLILLDLGMPRMGGMHAIEAIRGWTTVPIVVVSGRTGSVDKVAALDAGADDYITKPFQVDELLARLRALTRRHATENAEPIIRFGDVTLDLAAHAITRGGKPVHLTPTEWRMLEYLARNAGLLVTRQALLKEIWDTESVKDSGYLRLYMSQLRKKLEITPSAPAHLLTEQGMGYRLQIN